MLLDEEYPVGYCLTQIASNRKSEELAEITINKVNHLFCVSYWISNQLKIHNFCFLFLSKKLI